MVVGIAVLACNGLAGGLGAVLWVQGWISNWFWYALRAAQVTVVVQALIGFYLLARGAVAPDGLHVAYGVSPLVVTLVSELMRLGAAARQLEGVDDLEALTRNEQVSLARRVALAEIGVMTVGALLILTLALRGYQTGDP
jgi:hypothetical protein